MSQSPKDDCFAPPDEPCEVFCSHCKRVYDSALIRYVTVPGPLQGNWCCAVPGCEGKGYLFDLFPTDLAHENNNGWTSSDDDDCEDFNAARGLTDDEETEEDERQTSEWVSEEAAESADAFDPPVAWTPASDRPDPWDPAFGVEGGDDSSDIGKPFTWEEYQYSVDSGLYDSADQLLRASEARANAASEQDAREPKPFGPVNDDDLPF